MILNFHFSHLKMGGDLAKNMIDAKNKLIFDNDSLLKLLLNICVTINFKVK